ncbi:hypothetical protein K32_03350 [Kaistia sp. 32K]|nr:hypothetical protein K32_03350 [Kaistia sp. 32K]
MISLFMGLNEQVIVCFSTTNIPIPDETSQDSVPIFVADCAMAAGAIASRAAIARPAASPGERRAIRVFRVVANDMSIPFPDERKFFPLERFQAKWIPVRVKKARSNK